MSDVESQYTNWVYPIPIEDMRSAIANGTYWEIGDPLLYQPLFWPHKRSIERLDILIAGCGSVQAAYYACRNPNWNVTGVDLSESSLAHQQKLKERHGLSNLRLKRLDLTKVNTLDGNFDFIVSTGVLHHLPDPDAGLSALKEVLRPDGVMNLMVYGQSLRLGVYMMQEVFRLLNFHQTQADVDLVKATIRGLAPDHVVRRYIENAGDLHYDAAVVDTFLHLQDRAYRVDEVYAFTRNAGLEFLTWCDPQEYSLEAVIPQEHPLWEKVHNLPSETEAHICDLLTQIRGTHRWAAAHPYYVEKVRIPFDKDAFFDCVVLFHRQAKIIQIADIQKRQDTIYECGNKHYQMPFPLGEIIAQAGGRKSIRQVIAEMGFSPEERSGLLAFARDQFRRLWKMGHIHILLPEGA